MISIIVCSINADLLANLKSSIENTINITHEIIVVDNKKNTHSIASAYNFGASQAKYSYLCFVHEDILFHTIGWGNNLIDHFKDPGISLIGVLGNSVKTLTPSGAFMFNSKLMRINHLQKTQNGDTEIYYQNPNLETTSEVKVLDGMFLATTKNKFVKYPFDENLLKGFHGYDVDFSIGQSKIGKLVVVYDILLEHFSFGNYTIEWIEAQEKITKKWKQDLPLYINAASKSDIGIAEIINLKQLLILMLTNKYKKRCQLLYLLRLAILNPFSFSNFYFLRKLLIYGRTEDFMKKIKILLTHS